MNKKTIIRQYDKGNQMINFNLNVEETFENIDYNKLNNLADFCFNRMLNFTDIIKNISWIRTIYKDLKEIDLIMQVTTLGKDSKNIIVTYRKGELEFYKRFELPGTKFAKYNFVFTYSKQNGINISTNKTFDCEKLKELINSKIEQLKQLENVKPITLNYDSKLLCEIYKSFYQESPDFSEENINIKVQTMMSILEEFGITLEKYSGFSIYSHANFPISLNLEYLVNQLTPLGKINGIEDSVKLSEESRDTIETIGHIINETTFSTPEELVKISRILHARKYNLSSRASYQETAEFTSTSTSDVESSIQLVKKIEDTLRKQNEKI